jgi:hypothetical protein
VVRLAIVALATAMTFDAAVGQIAADAPRDPGQKSVQIARAATRPNIDGALDDAAWANAARIDNLHQVNPVEYAEPSERTEIYLLYDDDALYVGARMFTPPGGLTANVMRQGASITQEDSLFVTLDPFNTRRGGYFFGLNAHGVRYDGLYRNVSEYYSDWDSIWFAEAQEFEGGWTAEYEIPFKSLSFDPSSDTWGLNFSRSLETRNEDMAWVSRNRRWDPSTAGLMTGLSGINQGIGLDIVPSASFANRRVLRADNPATAAIDEADTADDDFEPSLDLFYKLTPQLNASLTFNTDFSATEVDDRQVNLSRFSLFFPERRDFFLNDADIFQFGRLQQDGRPFFSRRLGIGATGEPVPLDIGARVSGRIGRFDVGTLTVRQEAYANPFAAGGVVDATTALVGRVSANVLEESSVGMIVTQGNPSSNLDNRVAGVDFRYLNSQLLRGKSLEGDAWFQQSDSENLVGGDDAAFGVGVRLPSNTGFRGEAGYTRIEQNFNPALGFVRRTGIEDTQLEGGYTWRPNGRIVRQINSGLNASRIDNLDDGTVQSQNLNLQAVNVDFNSSDGIGLNVSQQKEGLRVPFTVSRGVTIPAGTYSFNNVNLSLRSADQRAFGGGLFINNGDFYDGERTSYTTFIGWRSPHFRANLNYQLNEVSFPGKGSELLSSGQPRCVELDCEFTTRVVRLSLETIFSSRLSWVNLIQYDNVSETVGLNSRLHWIPQAGREGFLVLNHNVRDDPLTPDDDFHSSFAEVTLKYSYTFRF